MASGDFSVCISERHKSSSSRRCLLSFWFGISWWCPPRSDTLRLARSLKRRPGHLAHLLGVLLDTGFASADIWEGDGFSDLHVPTLRTVWLDGDRSRRKSPRYRSDLDLCDDFEGARAGRLVTAGAGISSRGGATRDVISRF